MGANEVESLRWVVITGHLIGNVGFPVVVAGFLLFRVYPVLIELSASIKAATKILERMEAKGP